jgi:polar amino acid transport system substrate-binding protein
MRPLTSRLVAALAAATASAAVAGCAGTNDHALNLSLAALGTPTPTVQPRPAEPTAGCSDPTASLPPTALPAQGHMPPGSFMDTIVHRPHPYLIAGINQNYQLFGYLNPLNGHIEGFEIDLLHQIAKAIFGNPDAIRFKALSVPQRLPFVQNGSVDIVADAITMTCGRRTLVDFSTTYYDARQRVLVPSDSVARSLADLGGQRVCATAGSLPIQVLQSYPSHPIPWPEPQGTDCLVDLMDGTVAAISTDDSILLGFHKQDPNTRLVGRSLANAPYGMAISKAHPEFVRFVNAVLAHLRADGVWARIYHRWLGGTPPAPPQPHYQP